MSTKFTNRSLDFPDIEFHFVSGSPGSDGGRQIRKVGVNKAALSLNPSLNHSDLHNLTL